MMTRDRPVGALVQETRNPVTLAPGALDTVEAVEAFTGTCLATLRAPGTGALVLDLGWGEREAEGRIAGGSALAALDAPEALHQALCALANCLVAAEVPVVARLSGLVTGPAALLALAATLRVAGPSLGFGFPETRLGCLPPGGTLARAASWAGAGATLDAVLSGRVLTAREAQAAAVAARRLIEDGGAGLLRSPGIGLADPDRFLAEAAAHRARAQAEEDTLALAAVDCVEAALLLPAETAAAIEAEVVASLAARPAARGRLRLARAAERLGRGGPVPKRITVMGARPNEAPMIAALLARGIEVTLCDPGVERLRVTLEQVAELQDRAVERGELTGEARDAAWARIAASIDPTAPDEAEIELVTEAAADWLPPAGRAPRVTVDPLPGASGPLAGVSCHLTAAGGMLEIAAGRDTAGRDMAVGGTCGDTARRVAGLGESLGLVVLRLPQDLPLPVARLRFALWAAAADCLSLGLSGAALDGVLRAAGMAQGPVAMARAWGTEAVVALVGRLDERQQLQAQARAEGLALLLAELPEPGLAAPWRDAAAARDVCLAALADEGARILAARGLDGADAVDLAACHGLGLSPAQGGPMLWAERLGGRNRLLTARNLLRDMKARVAPVLGTGAAAFWDPAPLWEERIRSGQGF